MTNGEYPQLVEFLGRQFSAIDRRFAALEQRVDEGFREMRGHFDAIYGWLERLQQEYHALVEGVRRIEMMLADERGRREAIEHELAELKERVALLQVRISEIERRLQT